MLNLYTFELLIIPIFIAIIGAVLGSFGNVLVARIPHGEDFIFRKSHCRSCKKTLQPKHLVPILSWILLRGKCASCHAKISPRYILLEIACCLLALFTYHKYGISYYALIFFIFGYSLLIISAIDLETYIIPDSLQLILLTTAVLHTFEVNGNITDRLLAGSIWFAVAWLISFTFRFLRKKEGLGFGDVKFFFTSAFWLGTTNMIPFIFISGLSGVLMGILWSRITRNPYFPFAPALCLSLFLCVTFPAITECFWKMFEVLLKF